MEKRNVEITLDTARKWYYGDNESLKEVALQAFTKDELEEKYWKRITSFEISKYRKNISGCSRCWCRSS